MDNFKLHKIIYWLGFIILGILMCSTLIAHSLEYDKLIDFILNEINRKDLYDLITKTFFTKTKFEFVKNISIGISLLSFIGLFFYYKYRIKIESFIKEIIDKLKIHFQNYFLSLTKNKPVINKLLIVSFLAILSRSVYYALHYFITYDEAWNYNYFLHKNIAYTFFAYNNYPLHNIATWSLVKIFPDSTFLIRLPSILIGLLTCSFVFVFIKNIFKNETVALLSMLLFSCLPITICYSLRSRGVIFEIFFVFIVVYFLIKFLSKNLTNNRIVFISFLNALGTFSMLSHAYFICFSTLALIIILILENRLLELKFAILYGFLSVTFSTILLLPMMLGTGISLGLTASVQDASFLVLHHSLPIFNYSEYSSGNQFLVIILAVINIILVFQNENNSRRISIINLVLFSSIFFIPFLTGTLPAERTMGMLTLIPITTISILFLKYKNEIVYMIIIVSYCIFISCLTNKADYFKWSAVNDKNAFLMCNTLLDYNIKTIEDNASEFFYYYPLINYYYSLNNKSILISSSNKNSNRKNINFDLADCKIENISDTLVKGNIIFKNETIKIIKLK